ncbi:hypothetical protein HYR99_34175 [Candidatus Poribacteria bacterium]|nr:hypothetical protein [Candidatus Poribacteria bacterium]
MKQTDFEIGEELVEHGEYDSAFCFFEAITTDPNQIPPIRADAYTWMGTLVRIMPSLGDGDECGLSFSSGRSNCIQTMFGQRSGWNRRDIWRPLS